MTKYFDVHVFYNRNNGFSVPVKSNADDCSDDAIITLALTQGKLDSEDAKLVDYVEEINVEEFANMGGVL